ncbi:hypothetical protein GIS00_14530 [Nakamurella sp. YIM 132087]|uniref:PQQ-binding-like beta-propeller repeat protein n=1 Tax=Nakamurella alba TaxID=2665158 RepID=A0A7K1FLX0_9ACTN|nr:hypothetical protein [Nakamurella alba]MTD15157.1 hypothetical protein [Nakamurella alba]
MTVAVCAALLTLAGCSSSVAGSPARSNVSGSGSTAGEPATPIAPDVSGWIGSVEGGMAITAVVAVHEDDDGLEAFPMLPDTFEIKPTDTVVSGNRLFVPADLSSDACSGCDSPPGMFVLDAGTGELVETHVLADSGGIIDVIRAEDGRVWALLWGTADGMSIAVLEPTGELVDTVPIDGVEATSDSYSYNYLASRGADVFLAHAVGDSFTGHVDLLAFDQDLATTPVVELCDDLSRCATNCTNMPIDDQVAVEILCQYTGMGLWTVDVETKDVSTTYPEDTTPGIIRGSFPDGTMMSPKKDAYDLLDRDFTVIGDVAAVRVGDTDGFDAVAGAAAYTTDGSQLGLWDRTAPEFTTMIVKNNSAGLNLRQWAEPVLTSTGVWWVSRWGMFLLEPTATTTRTPIATIDTA